MLAVVAKCRAELSFRMFYIVCVLVFFFFQAEDGIRDYKVTGVQTCALPIWNKHWISCTKLMKSRLGGSGLPDMN